MSKPRSGRFSNNSVRHAAVGCGELRDASEDATMELYTAGTGNGQRAAIAVNECGITCKIHVLNLAQGDQKKPDYLKINPTGRIPTLIDPQGPDGKPLTLYQSWAILIYLAEKTGKLRANTPLAQARAFQWMAEGASDMAPTAQNIFFLGSRMPEKVPDSAVKFYEDRLLNPFPPPAPQPCR